MSRVLKGACLCGAVEFELSGDADSMGYCHCSSCRVWSGDPIHAWTIWRDEQVRVTAGAECVTTFHKTPESLSYRRYCSKCAGHLMIHHPSLGVFDVFPGAVPELTFAPSMHLNYAEAVMPLKDGLPKYRNFPKELEVFGGDGELIPE